MERLTKRSTDTIHENGVCCTHFNGPECRERRGRCIDDCPWEEAAWSRLAAYEDAEEEGRLVVLPCKVGDTVYIVGHRFMAHIDEVVINALDGITIMWSECDVSPELTELWDDGWFTPDDFGKTVFLTREEAEGALKGGKTE